MQTLLYLIKNYIHRLDQARRRTYLDQQRKRLKYFLKDKFKKGYIKLRWGGGNYNSFYISSTFFT